MAARTQEVKMTYSPQPKQDRFHACPADEVFYGGAAGGGKSYSLLHDALQFCLTHPNVDAVLFRRTFPEQEMYHIKVSRQVFPPGVGKYNASKYLWAFNNGSRLLFRAMKDPGDQFQYNTAEFPWIGFDELTHFLEDQYTYLISRNRSAAIDKSVPRQVKSASNPGNIGHSWVKRRFVDPAPANTVFARTNDMGVVTTRCFIPATIYDNQALMKADPTYIEKLMSMRPEERKKLLDGDWDICEGAAFPEWDGVNAGGHVVKPFPIPQSWRIDMCMDWGYQRPFWIGWIAWNYDDRPFLIREWYGCLLEEAKDPEGANKGLKIDAVDVAREARKKEGSTWKVRRRIAPADIWSKIGTGTSIASDLVRGGFNGLIKANRDREAGKVRIHELLKLDDHGEPFLRVFDTCRGFIRTFPMMQLDEKNCEDVDTDGEDHPYDGFRYGLMAHALPPDARPDVRGQRNTGQDYKRRQRQKVAGGNWKTN